MQALHQLLILPGRTLEDGHITMQMRTPYPRARYPKFLIQADRHNDLRNVMYTLRNSIQ